MLSQHALQMVTQHALQQVSGGVPGPGGGGSAPRGGLLWGGSAPGEGGGPGTATTAGCTHPTGMHSCSFVVSFALAESEFCH